VTARDDPDIRFPKRNRIFGRYTAHLMCDVFPLATALGIAAVRRVRTSPMVSARSSIWTTRGGSGESEILKDSNDGIALNWAQDQVSTEFGDNDRRGDSREELT